MAKKLLTSYTFTPGAANAGTLVVPGSYALEQFLLVTNVTTGATIYQFNSPAKGGAISTGGGNTTLTLEYNTSAMSSGDRLQVFLDDGQNPQFTLTNASVEVTNDAGNPLPVSGTVAVSGTTAVSAVALPLPSGASTAANQGTANSSLASIDGKVPALVSGAVPVTGTVAISNSSVEIANEVGNPVPISGTVTATGPLTDTQLRASAVPVSGTVAVSGTTPVSATALPLPAGAATETTLSALSGKVPASLTAAGGRLLVDGSGATQPVSGTFWQATQPVSAAALPLPAGAATSALQTTGNTSLASLDTDLGALADAAATTDTGSFSVISLIKRGLQNLTTLLGRVPALSLGAQAPGAAVATVGANRVAVNYAAAAPAINTDLLTNTVNGWYDTNGFFAGSVTVRTDASFTTTIFLFEQTNDNGNTFGNTLIATNVGAAAASQLTAGVTITPSNQSTFTFHPQCRYIRMRAQSTVSAGTIAAYFSLWQAPNDIKAAANQFVDLRNIVGAQFAAPTINGTTTVALGVCPISGNAIGEYSGQNVAAVSGSLGVAATTSSLPAYAFDVSIIAWSGGASTGLDIYLQESPDNGTTFYDIWQCEALTTVNRVRIPAIPINGRRRFRWVNRGGAATTATLAVIAMGTPAALPIQRQFFDRTSGVGSGTAVLNTNSTAYDIAGCKQISVVMQAGTATAVGSFQAQMSMDGTNWYAASAATAIGAGTANNTVIPITSGMVGRFIRVACTSAGTAQVINAIHLYGTN
jgi:hypothetical protein